MLRFLWKIPFDEKHSNINQTKSILAVWKAKENILATGFQITRRSCQWRGQRVLGPMGCSLTKEEDDI